MFYQPLFELVKAVQSVAQLGFGAVLAVDLQRGNVEFMFSNIDSDDCGHVRALHQVMTIITAPNPTL
jgi:hypothetical protein